MNDIYIVKETITYPYGDYDEHDDTYDYHTDTLYVTCCQTEELAKAAFEERKSKYFEMQEEREVHIVVNQPDTIEYDDTETLYRFSLTYRKVSVATCNEELNKATNWREVEDVTIGRVQQLAYHRGIYFSGEKKFRNTTVGYAYEIYTPDGRGFFQSDTLEGIYRKVLEFPKVDN